MLDGEKAMQPGIQMPLIEKVENSVSMLLWA